MLLTEADPDIIAGTLTGANIFKLEWTSLLEELVATKVGCLGFSQY